MRSSATALGVVAIVVALAHIVGTHGQNACGYSPMPGVTFDLAALEAADGYYVLDRFAGHNSHNYSYVFNVCKNVNHVPGSGPTAAGSACETETDDDRHLSGPGPAFQVARWFDGCYRLGDSWDDVDWKLMDSANPAYGVTIQYKNGQLCANGLKRSLELSFICSDDLVNIPNDAEEPVEEVDMCIYQVFLHSAYGCPTECPIVNGHLCNNHGVCGYDQDSKSAGCFCNTGWGGVGCIEQVSVSSGTSATSVVLIIACILLAVIMGSVVFMYLKLRRLQINPDSYKDLNGKFNELGQIAG